MAIGRYVDPTKYKKSKANERATETDLAALTADVPALAHSSLADKAHIEALRTEVKNISLPSFATPDAARYGDLALRMGAAEVDITDLIADVAAITAGDSLLAYSTLPLLGKVGGIDERLADAETEIDDLIADVAAITAGDPLLAYTALPDKAVIAALREEMKSIAPAWTTPDAARYGSVTVQLAELEEGLADAVADIAAIATGDPLLAHTALPDKARIEALRSEVGNILPASATPDAARYGSVTIQIAELQDGLEDVVATVASVTAGDSLLAHTASPDKARIGALSQEIKNIVPAWLTPDIARYGSLQYDVSGLTASVAFLGAGAAVQAQQITVLERTAAALAPLHGKVAALSRRMDDAVSPLLYSADAARYGSLDVRVGAAETGISDLAADVAAIVAGDPILAYSALPDKAAIGALRVEVAGLAEDVAGLAEDVAGLAVSDPLLGYTTLPDKARIEAQAQDFARNAALWYTPDAARYGSLDVRVGAAEEDIVGLASDIAAIVIGDPLLAYSALPDKAAIAALGARMDHDMRFFGLTPDAARYGALHYDVSALTVNITSLSTTAALQAQDIIELDRALASLYPLRATVGDLGNRVGAVEEEVAAASDPLLAYAALPDRARIGDLSQEVTGLGRAVASLHPLHAKAARVLGEVQQLRIEMSAFYSDRAQVAHVNNRLADLEVLSWL